MNLLIKVGINKNIYCIYSTGTRTLISDSKTSKCGNIITTIDIDSISSKTLIISDLTGVQIRFTKDTQKIAELIWILVFDFVASKKANSSMILKDYWH